ncbi:DUF4436 domain-containing protein [Mycolicibacterium sp. J2]|uniref:DUF4436 domain-containing protein n=1 Tax=Mycolicibacterium sp. J2 TaxID=2993511 RepID=UPI00224A7A0A|nr:DUF4436 domain-containing protein [Mycolicibacterium sp. J2]MCX2712270.1 DUF4436 domain-containing protein [Mycolicibacterium sp. J2]
MKVRVALGVFVIIAAYVTTIALYAATGLGSPRELPADQPVPGATSVVFDLEEVHAVKGEMVANVTVTPGPGLLDPVTHSLTEDLSVAIHSAVTPTTRSWAKGTVPGVFPVALTIAGNPGAYPFDRYRSGPITVEVLRGANRAPERTWASFVDRVPGWMFSVPSRGASDAPAVYRVDLHRSPSTAAFAAIILGALITIAVLGVVVATQTLRNQRKFQPPMTTWFAAMLFAVVPLRNALPDAPPMGTWVDVTVVLWVVVALVASMSIYIACWWRHLKPEGDDKR